MKRSFSRKVLALILAVLCVLTSIPFAVSADEGIKVEIVSFMRGSLENKDARASELLEARVTGYDGNVQELTYEWTSTLGTYLYVYNSHNMYYINNTDGEIEIYNSKVATSTNMAGRSYKDTFSGTGYCWAAIYGSNTSGAGTSIEDKNAFNGTITVKVKDKDGNILGSDTLTGTVTSSGFGWWQTTTYDGIVDSSLQADMDDVTIGIFEGDTRNVKDLLGESAIVHITCVESKVSSGQVVSGGQYISLSGNAQDDYYITGIKAGTNADENGDAKVKLKVEKNTCKFHEKTSAEATTTVYVFKKPTTSTTAYTLTLTGNIDDRCTYYINGQTGIRETVNGNTTITFTGLNPNTSYEVEVRGHYKDDANNERVAYAFVYDTTKPVYTGTVEVYLNGEYDSANHTVTKGEKINLEDVTSYSTLYAKNINGTEFIELTKRADGTYSSILDSGSYQLYYTADESTKVDEQLLTMHNADRTRYLFYNSVQYIDRGTDLGTEYHVTDSAVTTRTAPQREGYVFTGWKDENGNIYDANSPLTDAIAIPYVLYAQWVKGIDVTVNFTINHYDNSNGHYIDNKNRHNITFDLMSRDEGTDVNYEDVFPYTMEILWDGKEGTFSQEGYTLTYNDSTEGVDTTTYTATAPLLTNALPGKEYSVEVIKSGYEIRNISSTTDTDGNITLDVLLQYEPLDADLTFSVELDSESKELIKKHPEFKPKEVHVKVLSWYTDGYKEINANTWEHISQHHDTYVTLYLDENGNATGSYPVWMHNNEQTEYYYYRMKVVSYVLANGTTVSSDDVPGLEHIRYVSESKRYYADIEVTDGKVPAGTSLSGAHFENAAGTQEGTLKAIIHIDTHNVTFKPEGGTLNGSTDDLNLTQQLVVPDISDYVPTREGGYVFNGWYMKDNTEIETGDELTRDIVLYADWKEPLTIEGNVFVAGYYYLNENTEDIRLINEVARTHAITINLQKVLPNNYTETIETVKVPVTYNDANGTTADKPIGTAFYSFTGIPDDGHEYRILLQNPNYIVSYQNEPKSLDPALINQFRTDYSDTAFEAEFGEVEPLIADINAFMRFDPHEFNLHYQVIATTVGEGFRPSSTEILVRCDDGTNGINPQNWAVITQMIKNGVEKGQDTAVGADGISDVESYPVWIVKPDGHSLYDYGVSLKDYTINGVETSFDADSAPFMVSYNGHARYSALENLNPEHQTQLLTVELHPKRYEITFEPGFTETEADHISEFIYTVSPTVHETSHIWSYTTDLSDAIPVREGYKFLGWYDKDGNEVTAVDASVYEDITLTAKWEKLFTVTFHANNEAAPEDIFRVYYEQGNAPDGTLSLNDNNTISSFYDIPEFDYETHNKYIFKGWYLDKDNENDTRPISRADVYTEDTHIYAHWIVSDSVAKDAEDTKEIPYADNMYPEYDLVGVQIRDVVPDSSHHYGKAGTGLRFITVLSENVYTDINNITDKNSNGVEYGFVIARTDTTEKAAAHYGFAKEDYRLEYKGDNVNGVNTSKTYSYVQNMKSSGYDDHRTYDDYRLYTAVITYDGIEGDALTQAQNTAITARSYIRYYDANGLYRTYYNNYTGTYSFGGCSASFASISQGMKAEQINE